jgi:hypothetical protein
MPRMDPLYTHHLDGGRPLWSALSRVIQARRSSHNDIIMSLGAYMATLEVLWSAESKTST